jgi:hypothetical protein
MGLSQKSGVDAPFSFVIARNSAVISIHTYPPADEWPQRRTVERAVIDALSRQRGAFRVCFTPGMQSGAIEVSVSRSDGSLLKACSIESALPGDAIEEQISALVGHL